MFKPVSLFIGLRYTRAKRRNHFISLISLISMLCFAVGVTALITVLSVMNGFDDAIRTRIFSMAPQVTITTFYNLITDWEVVEKEAVKLPEVKAIAPYIAGQGMLSAYGQASASLVYGILPEYETKVSELRDKMQNGSLSDLKEGSFNIVLGQVLAANLNANVGDKVTLITPTASATPMGIIPRLKRFTVVGIFKMGNGFGFDSSYAYINLHDAQKLYNTEKGVTGLRLKLNDLYKAPAVSHQLQKILPSDYIISNWTQEYGGFFQAIALEKTMMFIILMLIILVAAFSLISTLYMVVTDKQSDIAILRTYGATPGTILRIFMVQGILIGIVGTMLGLVGGILLALNVTDLVDWLQSYFHTHLLSSNVYYVDYLPSKIEANDVIKVCVVALIVSVLATLFPAWRGSRVQPAESLRYE